MANISSIGGNPIVPGAVQNNSVTDAMLVQTGGVLETVSQKLDSFEQFGFTVENSRVSIDGNIVPSTGQGRTDYISCDSGTQVEYHGMSFIYQGATVMLLVAFYDSSKSFISGVTKIADETASTVGTITTTAPEGTAYVIASTNNLADSSSYYLRLFDVEKKFSDMLVNLELVSNDVRRAQNKFINKPVLSNGSPGNQYNQYAIRTDFVDNIYDGRFTLYTDIELPSDEYQYRWIIKVYAAKEDSGSSDYPFNSTSKKLYVELPSSINTYKYMRIGLFINLIGSEDTTVYPLRVESVGTDAITVMQVPSFDNLDDVNSYRNPFVSSDYNLDDTIDAKCASYSAEFVGLEDTESFVFFTDPHIFPHTAQEENMEKAIGTIEYAYNNTPTSFVLCGGDWLTNGDSASEAAYKLGRIDGIMRAKFGFRYYPILGNHDNNYQGEGGAYPNPSEYTLSNDTLRQLWFREYGANYYEFQTPSGTRFYVFDTGTDWNTSMDAYRWEQVDWFAQKLAEHDDEHSVIAMHIVINSGTSVAPMADNVTKVAEAYNSKTSVTLNGNTYDFGSTTGKVAFVIAGHTHADSVGVLNNIPYIITVNSAYTPSFDLCLIDYDNAKLKTVRVGNGSDREISIINS